MITENPESSEGPCGPQIGCMNNTTTTNPSEPSACTSFATAIVIVPPERLHRDIDILRSVYDKSYPRWAPHITMAIPFVPPSELPNAVDRIRTLFASCDLLNPWSISFTGTDVFHHKDSATVYLRPDEYSQERLRNIREALDTLFKIPSSGDGVFRPHLTIGQTSLDVSMLELQQKSTTLMPISWTVDSLLVISKNQAAGGRMEIFTSIPKFDASVLPPVAVQPTAPCCYSYNGSLGQYTVYSPPPSLFNTSVLPSKMTISTYNILHSPLQPQTQSSPRLRIILNTILQQSSTLLILQEVTDIAWQFFLSNHSFRDKFPYVSAPSHLSLPNRRNIVLLSAIPFKSYYLPLFTPHKPALIISLDNLIIAGVHLHAGLHEEKLAIKLKELSKLTTFLESTAEPTIIAGDFNIPSIPREYSAALPKIHEILEKYVDAWVEKPCKGGDTFTPDTNRFAKEGTKVLYPQRHDRVYFSKGAGIVVEKTWLFGFPESEEELGSDHWGLSVDFRVNFNASEETDVVADTVSVDVPETSWTDKEMSQLLIEANELPDVEHDGNTEAALALLRSVLAPMNQHFQYKLEPVGSFALDVHSRSSDLDILIVSTISPKTFWELFFQHIQRFKLSDPRNRIKVIRIIKNARQPLVELLIDTYKVEVLYGPVGRLFPCWDQLPSLPSSSDLFLLPTQVLDILVSYRDHFAILSLVPNLETFRLARRAFKYFCSRRGIYGAKFGFLGGFAVTLLIAAICKCLPTNTPASRIVAAALSRYADFPWESEILWFPGVEKGNVRREEREAMYIPAISRSSHNVTINASRPTLRTMEREFRAAFEKLSLVGFDEICGDGLNDFFARYKSLIKIQCAFWGVHAAEGRKWISWIESRLVILLVNLAKEFPTLDVRLWPARFADVTSDDIQGTYIVGVSGTGLNEGVFLAVLRDVERMMKGEEAEVVDRWVSVTLAKGKDFLAEKLEIDIRVWDGEEDIILEEELIEEEEEESILPVSKLTVSEAKHGKLRPSQDIFNRLLWDARYSADEYLVGYEDRFKGVREMPLTSWKREFTDEEYIPLHRIVYFREKGAEGKIVWDRRTRIDLIFGSGQKLGV